MFDATLAELEALFDLDPTCTRQPRRDDLNVDVVWLRIEELRAFAARPRGATRPA